MRSIISFLSPLLFVPISSCALLMDSSPVGLAPLTTASPSLRSGTRTVPSNSTRVDNFTWCHKDLGQHLIAQLPDCERVLNVLQNRDIKSVGTEAVFSWDATIATSSRDNIYLLPQTIERGSCRVRVELNGVKSVRALWDLDIWDSFGQLMADCVIKRGLGGFTFAERTGTGLRVTLKGTNGYGDTIDPSGGAAMGREYQAPTGTTPTW